MSSTDVPPANLEAEENVLGACLISQGAVDTATELLEPQHFYRETHGTIFAAIQGLKERGDPVDAIIVAAELERLGILERVGGQSRIAELAALVTAASNVAHYAAIVVEAARSRSVIKVALAVQQAASNGGLAMHPELIDQAIVALEDARQLPGEPGLPEGPVFLNINDFVARQFAPPEPLLGTDMLPIIAGGSFNLLAGRPGAGKTTLLMDAVCHMAAGVPWPSSDGSNRAPEPWPVPRPLNVAIIENEGPQESFRGKLEEKLKRFPHEIRGTILIHGLQWGAFSFADRSLMARVRSEFDAYDIDLVVGDPLASLGLEGVGSPAETLQFIQLLQPLGLRTHRAFLFLHHFRERREKTEDELASLSGAWGGHLDTLLTLGATDTEDHLRLAYPKLRWARTRTPHPVVLGKVWNLIGFEAIGEEGETFLLEPKIVDELRAARNAGRGINGWQMTDEIRVAIEARRADVKKALEGAPHLFTSVTGAAAKAMGAKSAKAILWGLKEWEDDRPQQSSVENSEQGRLADLNVAGQGELPADEDPPAPGDDDFPF